MSELKKERKSLSLACPYCDSNVRPRMEHDSNPNNPEYTANGFECTNVKCLEEWDLEGQPDS